jgi:hypothetical protein
MNRRRHCLLYLDAHAGKTAEITVETDTHQITIDDGITIAAARKNSRDIKRHKASNYGHLLER